mgnify:CR=1 FL=1
MRDQTQHSFTCRQDERGEWITNPPHRAALANVFRDKRVRDSGSVPQARGSVLRYRIVAIRDLQVGDPKSTVATVSLERRVGAAAS